MYFSTLLFLGFCSFGSIFSSCQDGWLTHSGRCYFLSHSVIPWADAVMLCKQIGGQLAEINDGFEGIYLENNAKLLKTDFYIGAHDILVPNNWEWVTSQSSLNSTGYKNWAPGMPSNTSDHDCAYLRNQDGRWVNGRCMDSLNFICEADYM